MQNFLKRFSSAPSEFIDDFFYISKEEYNDNDFCIDFDLVVKWFNVRKR